MIIVGILLEILAAAVGTTSKQLIAYSEHVHKKWLFHIGASMNIFLGPAIDASAYAFAPQVVVAPFASLDVIFNALTAPYTLKWQEETLSWVHLLACLLVAAGAAFTSLLGSVQDVLLDVYEVERQLTKVNSLLYFAVEAAVIIGLNLCYKWQWLSASAQGATLGIVAGILVGNVFCMKGFISIVRSSIDSGDYDAFLRPTPYILIAAAGASALLGHVYMRKGLGRYKGVFMITIFEGAHITSACLSGDVVMEEMKHASWWRYVLYWLALFLIIGGVMIINTLAAQSQLRSPIVQQDAALVEHVDASGRRDRVLSEPCALDTDGPEAA